MRSDVCCFWRADDVISVSMVAGGNDDDDDGARPHTSITDKKVEKTKTISF